jgi:hypothetical protein
MQLLDCNSIRVTPGGTIYAEKLFFETSTAGRIKKRT